MTWLYRYSIIRFRPFAETGEFANIGVLVTEVGTGQSAFRLAAKRFSRVRHFFDEVAYDAYRKANGYIRRELERTVRELPLLRSRDDESYFDDLSRLRESSILFSKSRTLKSSDFLEEVAETLFGRYIGRNFSGAENVEAALTRKLRATLRKRGYTHFRNVRVDDDVVPIILPLAYRSDEIYGIKPLAFSQKSPLSVFDHGSSWKHRLEYLLEKGKLQPENILLALQPPQNSEEAFEEAYHLVEQELSELPFERVLADHTVSLGDAVVQFAERTPVDRSIFTRH